MSEEKWNRVLAADCAAKAAADELRAAALDIVGDRDCAVSVTVWAGTFSYAAISLSTTAIGNEDRANFFAYGCGMPSVPGDIHENLTDAMAKLDRYIALKARVEAIDETRPE